MKFADYAKDFDGKQFGIWEYMRPAVLPTFQKEGITSDKDKFLWFICNKRNGLGYIGMPLFGICALVLYSYTRIQGITPDLSMSLAAQIAIPATILVALLGGDYYVRNHKRTWEGPELLEHLQPN